MSASFFDLIILVLQKERKKLGSLTGFKLLKIFASLNPKTNCRTQGPHRPDAIRQRNATFKFSKVNKTEHENKNLEKCADQLA